MGTFVLFFTCTLCSIILLSEFEVKIDSMRGFFELVYYVIITMTSVGYGSIYSMSNPGRLSIVITVFFGCCFIAFFLMALHKLLKMDENEQKSY
jgi:hypothetical protein